ncbi:MAG: hypothetical protein GY841_16035 [FCB group bacterium]|nr:hypothetical protein [FCB group bacterium]
MKSLDYCIKKHGKDLSAGDVAALRESHARLLGEKHTAAEAKRGAAEEMADSVDSRIANINAQIEKAIGPPMEVAPEQPKTPKPSAPKTPKAKPKKAKGAVDEATAESWAKTLGVKLDKKEPNTGLWQFTDPKTHATYSGNDLETLRKQFAYILETNGVKAPKAKKPTTEKAKKGEAPKGKKPAAEKVKKKKAGLEDIEVTGGKDKTVKVEMPESQADALTPKQQKAYLLAEIDKAIGSAKSGGRVYYSPSKVASDEQLNKEAKEAWKENLKRFGTVTIEVPGDGEFTVLNSKEALAEFKKKAKSFPLKPESAKRSGLPSTKPSGKRITNFDGFYYHDYKPQKQGIIERTKDNEGTFWVGGYVSDGSYAVKVAKKPKLKKGISENKPDIKAVLVGKLTPVKFEGEWYYSAVYSGSNQTLIHIVSPIETNIADKGEAVHIAAKYVDSILTLHPKAKPFINEGGVIVFKSGNNRVGVVMPVRADFPAHVSELYKKRTEQYTTQLDNEYPGAINEELTLRDFQDAFPGAKVGMLYHRTKGPSVYVRFKDGNGIIISLVPKIVGNSVRFEATRGRMMKKGDTIIGVSTGGTIFLRQDKAGRVALDHEKIHEFEKMGYVTPYEQEVLNRYLLKQKKAGNWNYKTEKNRPTAEDRAQWIAENLANRRNIKGVIGRILRKIGDLVDALVNMHHRTARGILRDVESGKITKRQGTPGKGGAQYTYTGQKAKRSGIGTARMASAVTRESDGEDASEGSKIHKATGWFLGWDNKWRFEIDDSRIKIKPEGLEEKRIQSLTEVVEHPTLFDAYPQLKDVSVEIDYKHSKLSEVFNQEGTGSLSKLHGYQHIKVKAKNPVDAKETLLHEIQHAVQEIEGFARGTSLKSLRNPQTQLWWAKNIKIGRELMSAHGYTAEKAVEQMKSSANYEGYEKYIDVASIDNPPIDLDAAIKKYSDRVAKGEKWSPMGQYLRFMGEIEARDTASRADLTPEQRKQQKPYKSQGIAKEDAIIRFGTGAQYSTKQAKFSPVDTANRKVLSIGQAPRQSPFFSSDFEENIKGYTIKRIKEVAAGKRNTWDETQELMDDLVDEEVIRKATIRMIDFYRRSPKIAKRYAKANNLRSLSGDYFHGVPATEADIKSVMDKNSIHDFADQASKMFVKEQLDYLFKKYGVEISKEDFHEEIENGWSEMELYDFHMTGGMEGMVKELEDLPKYLHAKKTSLPVYVGEEKSSKAGAQYSTTADATAMDNLFEKSPTLTKFKTATKDWIATNLSATQIFDRFDPVKALGTAAYQLHRGVGGIQSIMNAFMEHGYIAWQDNSLVHKDTPTWMQSRNIMGKMADRKGFMYWVKSLGDDADVFFNYVQAKRAEAIMKADDDKGWRATLKPKQIQEGLDAGKDGPQHSKYDTWEDMNKDFQQWNKNILQVAQDAGLIDPSERAKWEQDWYVPFYRIFEDELTRKEYLKGPNRGKINLSAQIFKLKGSEKDIGDPLTNMLKNWTHLISESLRNKARAVAFEQGRKITTKIDGAEVPVLQKIKPNDVYIFKTVPFEASYKKKRYDKDGKEIKRKWKVTFASKKTGEPVLSFQENGKPVFFKVNDPEMYVAMSHFAQNAEFLNNPVIKAMTGARRWLTYGATFGPAFKIANFIRDTLHVAIISKSFKPFVDSFAGAWKILKKDPEYINYLASGHAFAGSYIAADNPESAAKYIKKIMKKEGKGAKDRILDSPAKLLRFWERIGEASENAARVGLYSKRLKEGVGHGDAAFEARDLLDFQMKGTSGVVQFITATVPFTNARMQGLYRLGRATKEDPKSVGLKTAYLMGASLALWAMFSDDDRYKELENWDRWAYYHFWIGDQHYRVPKPFEIGALASTLPEAIANVTKGNDEAKHIWDTTLQVVSETFAFNPMPQLMKPLYEAYTNKNMFTGRQIVGTRLQGLPTELQYDPWDSATTRLAGKLGISPKKAEHVIRGYFSSIGMLTLWGTDKAMKFAGDYPEPPTTWRDTPVIRRFFPRDPAKYTKFQTMFYEYAQEADGFQRALKQAMSPEDIKDIYDKKGDLLRFRKYFGRVRKRLTGLNKRARAIWTGDKPPEEKRDLIDAIQRQKNKLAQRAVSRYKQSKTE